MLIVVLFSKVLTLVYLMTNEDVLVDRQYSHGAALTLREGTAPAMPEDASPMYVKTHEDNLRNCTLRAGA